MTRLRISFLLACCACSGPGATTNNSPDSGTDSEPPPTVDAPTEEVAEGTPGQFDPDSCTPYTAHFLDNSAASVKRCTVYYGGQQNLGQCLGNLCYNELEVILPTTFVKGTKVPAIVYIHGGGWATGSYVEGNSAPNEDYLKRGVAVISLNYRLSPQNTKGTRQGLDPDKSDPHFFVTMKSGRYDVPNPYATALADVKTAVQYIRSHMGETIDGDNLIAMGHSAGAHLALMLAETGSATNSNDDPNLRGRGGSWSTKVRAAVVKDPAIDFGLFVGPKDQLPGCGELLSQANKAANMCGFSNHPTPPAAWDSMTLGTGLKDLCVDKSGPGNTYQYDTWGSNYFDESNPWSTTMVGGDPLVVAPTAATNYYQWLVSPTSYLSPDNAPMYIINGVCDAEVPARAVRDFGTRGASLGMSDLQLHVDLPQGGGHNDAMNESVNPGVNQRVRQWLSDNGVPVVVAP